MLAQRKALRRIGIEPPYWIRLTIAGACLGVVAAAIRTGNGWWDLDVPTAVRWGLLLGAGIGFGHWLALRDALRWGWLLIPATAGTLALIPHLIILSAHVFHGFGWVPALSRLVVAVALYPAVTGLLIVGLRTEPRSSARVGVVRRSPAQSILWIGGAALVVAVTYIGINAWGQRHAWADFQQERHLEAPAPVAGLPSVVAVTALVDRSFAIGEDGSVWAWGGNPDGVLGFAGGDGQSTNEYDGRTTAVQSVPRVVSGLPPIAQVAAGQDHAVAVARDGTVWTWGGNLGEELGETAAASCVPAAQDDGRCPQLPAQVVGLANVVAVGAGDHLSVAQTSDGQVVAWGWVVAGSGQLVDCSRSPVEHFAATPIRLPELDGAVQIAVFGDTIVTRRTDGSVWTWRGRWGHAPEQVAGLTDAVWVGIDARGGLAVDRSGVPWNFYAGGCPVAVNATVPAGWQPSRPATRLGFPSPVRLVARTSGAIVAVAHDGGLLGQGDARGGIPGAEPTDTCREEHVTSDVNWTERYPCLNAPQSISQVSTAVALAIGNAHVLALDANGVLWSWGSATNGRLGHEQ